MTNMNKHIIRQHTNCLGNCLPGGLSKVRFWRKECPPISCSEPFGTVRCVPWYAFESAYLSLNLASPLFACVRAHSAL
jgi:hypothetical protein